MQLRSMWGLLRLTFLLPVAALLLLWTSGGGSGASSSGGGGGGSGGSSSGGPSSFASILGLRGQRESSLSKIFSSAYGESLHAVLSPSPTLSSLPTATGTGSATPTPASASASPPPPSTTGTATASASAAATATGTGTAAGTPAATPTASASSGGTPSTSPPPAAPSVRASPAAAPPFATTVFAEPLPGDAAGWRAWAAAPREQTFAPARAAPPRLLPFGGRYLVPMMIVEGFGAWSDAIYETMQLAARLGRTWVEPCVRNGCIEPCRCGFVRPVAPWSAAAAASAAEAGVDPARLPRIDDPCKLDIPQRVRADDYVAEAYPLSAYLDVEALAAELAPGAAVSYADWCATYAAEYAPVTDGHWKRWSASHYYNYDMVLDQAAIGTPWAVGDFIFSRTKKGGGEDALAADPSPSLFLAMYYRGSFGAPYSFPHVPLSRWHTGAVARYVREQLAGPPFAAFHWRSEQADPSLFLNCSRELARIAAAALPAHARPHTPRLALLADMPAPGNMARMWNDYGGGEGDLQREAMGYMVEHGFVKYDAHIGVTPEPEHSVDAGVLSVRDFILAVTADLYVTCQGDHWQTCHGCFRSGSNLALRITKARDAKQLPSMQAWFALKPEDVPPSLVNAKDGGAR